LGAEEGAGENMGFRCDSEYELENSAVRMQEDLAAAETGSRSGL